MINRIDEDQPLPGDDVIQEGEPCCIELSLPGGQPVAMMLVRRVPVEDVILSIIPSFRAQTGFRGPLGFKIRELNIAEQVALSAVSTQ